MVMFERRTRLHEHLDAYLRGQSDLDQFLLALLATKPVATLHLDRRGETIAMFACGQARYAVGEIDWQPEGEPQPT